MRLDDAVVALCALGGLSAVAGGCHLRPKDDADGGRSQDAASTMHATAIVAVGGTRLKARFAQGPLGARSFVGWYDTLLETVCAFATAADGELRCLPEADSLPTPPTDFADAACTTTAVIDAAPDCKSDASLFLRRDEPFGCGTRQHIYKRGKRIAENRTFSKDRMDTCTAIPLLKGYGAFELGPELPASSFMKGTTVVQPSPKAAAALDLVLLEARDGAKQPWGG